MEREIRAFAERQATREGNQSLLRKFSIMREILWMYLAKLENHSDNLYDELEEMGRINPHSHRTEALINEWVHISEQVEELEKILNGRKKVPIAGKAQKKPKTSLRELLKERLVETERFITLRKSLTRQKEITYQQLADEMARRGLDSEKAQILLKKIKRQNRGIRRYRKLAGEN